MKNTWLYSDPHFGHANICKFTNHDGSALRPWDDVDIMDSEMIQWYNETVKPGDKVYFLGDTVINKKHLYKVGQLNGDKVLIKGNHDIFKLSDYTEFFRDIRAYHVLNGLIMSHIPVHADSIARFGANVHGHLHGNRVKKAAGFADGKIVYGDEIDPNYWCACVEHTNFRPINFDEVLSKIVEQGGQIGFRNGNGPSAM